MTSKYSHTEDGKVLDFKFVKANHPNCDIWLFYIGEKFIGQIFKISKNSWTAIPFDYPLGMTIDNLNSRMAAAEFMLNWRLLQRSITKQE